jgi:CheY-like chemotaxis protein
MTTRILVVDDEPDLKGLMLQKFRQQVRDGTFSFQFVRDGVEALEALKADDGIVLVVTDINMPRMDGLSCCRKYKKRRKSYRRRPVTAPAMRRYLQPFVALCPDYRPGVYSGSRSPRD